MYYVYKHISKKTGLVFYVGQGSKRRAFSDKSRNKHWQSVANSHGYTVEICMTFSSRPCSFTYEKILINSIGLNRLTNVTRGGEGGVGLKSGKGHPMYGRTGKNHHRFGKKFSDDERQRIKEGRAKGKKNTLSEEGRMKISRSSKGNSHAKGLKHSPETIAYISNCMTGDKNPSYKSDVFKFIHSEMNVFFCGTMHEFCKKFNLNKGNVCWMIKGKNKSVKGWKMS